MKGKMYSTDRYVYYDFSIEEHEKERAKVAWQNKVSLNTPSHLNGRHCNRKLTTIINCQSN